MSKALALVALVLVAGCVPAQDTDAGAICDAALQGVQTNNYLDLYDQCRSEVWQAEMTAGYAAAQRFRDMKR